MPGPDFSALTEQIIAAVEANPSAPDLPWRRAGLRLPTNALTKNTYRGVNVLSLWASATRQSFQFPVWASYRQWAAIGAQVRRGERGTTIIYFQGPVASDDQPEEVRRPVVRSSVVFAAEQVTGYQPPTPPTPADPWTRYEPADAFIRQTGADIRFGGDEAFYTPTGDFIQMPRPEDFIDTTTSTAREGFYSTAFHELAHWTGAKKRLDRDLSGRFGSRSYAMEELVAELTAAFISADLALTPALRPDHARYIANWAAVLREDARAISVAAGRAADSMEYLKAGASAA